MLNEYLPIDFTKARLESLFHSVEVPAIEGVPTLARKLTIERHFVDLEKTITG